MKHGLWAKIPTRVNFYSPREETEQPVLPKSNAKGATAKKPAAAPKGVTNAQVMESLAALTDQVWLQNLLENQGVRDGVTPVAEQHGGGRPMHFAGLPSVSASLANISVFGRYPKGPPPKTKAPLEALQGSPCTSRDAYDSLGSCWSRPDRRWSGLSLSSAEQCDHSLGSSSDVSSRSSGRSFFDWGRWNVTSTSTKGSQRRERTQSELANGTSTCYLSMMQQVHRRMFPGKPVPRSETELSSVSLLAYLERTGGYKSREGRQDSSCGS